MKVVSKKDQAQYWYPKDQPFSYVSVDKFESIFKELDFMWEGNKLRSSLSLSIKLVLKKCFVIQYLLLEKMGSMLEFLCVDLHNQFDNIINQC